MTFNLKASGYLIKWSKNWYINKFYYSSCDILFYSKQVFVLTHHPTGRPGERKGENKWYRFYLQYFFSHKPCDRMEKQLMFLFDAWLVTHQDKAGVFTPIIFEPPTNAVLPAQVCLAAFKAIVSLDVCSAVICFCGKSRHPQMALVSAGGWCYQLLMVLWRQGINWKFRCPSRGSAVTRHF